MQSDSVQYDPVSQAFHWLTAIFVVVAFILGPEGFGRAVRHGLDPATRWDIVTHETLGLSVFVLTLLRLAWGLVRPTPPRFDLIRWMHIASKTVQSLLWLLMLLLPITALLTLGSESFPLTLVGGLRIDKLPWIAQSNIAHWADWGDVHGLLGDVIIWVAAVHAAAAIFHQIILKDRVLRSMLPWR